MDTKEYLNILMTIIGGLLSLVGFLVWRILHRIENKLEELHDMSHSCRETLPERFMTREENKKFDFEFNRIWNAVNFHEHDQDGNVIRLT
jgi:hypothetical protein